MTEIGNQRKDRFYEINKGFASEGDPINCSFYNRIGACKNVTSCLKKHIVPSLSKTLVLPHLFNLDEFSSFYLLNNLDHVQETNKHSTLKDLSIHAFYSYFINKLNTKFTIEEFYICENESPHLKGNVYLKFLSESDAEKALKALNLGFYKNQLVYCEFSPVLDFGEAKCKQFDDGICMRKESCNFLHTFRVPEEFKKCLKISNKYKNDKVGESLVSSRKYIEYKQDRIYIEKESDRLRRIKQNVERLYRT